MKSSRGYAPKFCALWLRRSTTIFQALFTTRKLQTCSTINVLVDIVGSKMYFGFLSKVRK